MSIDFSYLIPIPNLTPEDSNVLSFTGLPGTISQEPQTGRQRRPVLNNDSLCSPPPCPSLKSFFLINANSQNRVASDCSEFWADAGFPGVL